MQVQLYFSDRRRDEKKLYSQTGIHFHDKSSFMISLDLFGMNMICIVLNLAVSALKLLWFCSFKFDEAAQIPFKKYSANKKIGFLAFPAF